MPVNQDACRLGISTLLQQELELAERFETLLGDEYRVIASRDIAALEQLIGDKARLLEQLAGLEQERTALLKGAGFETGHPGMTHCLRWCDPQQQITPLWQRLQSQARICDNLNRKNQQLVDLCSRHAREALHLLRGEEPGQNTYQADGESDHHHSSRSLAKA
ncbi:MAG: flagellar protein FlgN [Gammaproteobacteria bacterium]